MMRGIPKEQIEALVESLGGVVLRMDAHVDAWVSYRYVKRRER